MTTSDRREDGQATTNIGARHTVLMEAASDAIIIIDAESTILDANNAAAAMFGFDAGALHGRNLAEVQAPSLRAGHDAGMARYLATGERRVSWQASTVTARHRDGREFPVEISFGEFTEGGEPRFLGVIRDTSERIRLESQLRQAQKIEALGLLAGGIVHDFNNLLTAIAGHADLADAALGTDHPAREDLDQIRGTVDRASALTRQLLAFSRREPIRPVEFDPAAALASLAPLLRRLVGADVRVAADAPVGQMTVLMDATQFDQILINLAANGRDAMAHGGTLTISMESTPGRSQRSGAPRSASGWVEVRVTDTGTGMSLHTQEQIFDPFFTTKDARHGTGLGLATVHGIVHQAGGSIEVSSQVGAGTTFRILLPLHDQRSGRPGSGPPVPLLAGMPVVFLLLRETVRQTLASQVLARAGCIVISPAEGQDAIDLAGSSDRIDLLITDLRLPGHPSLARAVRGRHPDVPIIYVSDPLRGSPGKVRAGEPSGVFLPNPFTADQLLSLVQAQGAWTAPRP